MGLGLINHRACLMRIGKSQTRAMLKNILRDLPISYLCTKVVQFK